MFEDLGDEARLGSLPVETLRLHAGAIEALHTLGIYQIKQLQSLPRTSLPSRFGPEVTRRLDQAFGRVPELITPVHLPEPIEASWPFEHPTCDRRTLEAAMRQLVEKVVRTLAARQEGALRLVVSWDSTSEKGIHNASIAVGMLRPSASPDHVTGLVLARWEQTPPAGDVVRLQIQTTATARLESSQTPLFDDRNQKPDERELAQLIDRMSSRLGKHRVLLPRLVPDAQPEFAIHWMPLLETTQNPPLSTSSSIFLTEQWPMHDVVTVARRWEQCSKAHVLANVATKTVNDIRYYPAFARPLCLRSKPLAIEVTAVTPEGPPMHFFSKRGTHTIARSWGPERIETGWWRRRYVQRDYYRVETEDGNRFWLFRRIADGNWFLHGEFE